jgi:hypothetical protein
MTTTLFGFTYEILKTDNTVISSIENIYPLDTAIGPNTSNYKADAGDFDNNTSNGGTPAGAGDFDNQTTAGGFSFVEAGDFDTGTAILFPQPPLPSSASDANGDTDYENNVGIAVQDENNNQILVDTLPTGLGETQTSFDIIIEGDFVVDVRCILKTSIVETEGFDYGYCRNPLGFEIDFGTIAAPVSFNADFGTIGSPLIPTISSVVS